MRYYCSNCHKRFRKTEQNTIRHTSEKLCDECLSLLQIFNLLKKVNLALKKSIYWLNILGPKSNKFVNDRIKAVQYITKTQEELERFLDESNNQHQS